MNPSLDSTAQNSAEEAFAAGFYCAESVVLALAKTQGIESELLPKLATAFCSGMARTCGTCGALTGAMMGISLKYGRSAPDESVHMTYAATQELVREFEQTFGSRDCQTLLGCDLGTQEGQEFFRQNQLGERCTRFTSLATAMTARILATDFPPK